jgi:SAM-dependent methyltransferase
MSRPVPVLDPPGAIRVLHLGSGRKGREVPLVSEAKLHVTTLDADAFVRPDLVCELGVQPIPLPDNSIDVAVAVHVLEHIGKQGETPEWFAFWEELYRVLAPDGELRFESPLYDSTWAWADPSHTRALSPQAFVFFSQDSYRVPGSAISPYRIRCDFVPAEPFVGVPDSNPEIAAVEQFSHFRGTLRAVKPFRP